MKGTHHIIVASKRLHYEFDIRRNLTIIRGDSATGKTTLVDMIQEYVNNPSGSSVTVQCDKACYVIAGATWQGQLSVIRDGIIFVDEGNDFVHSTEFSSAIQQTDNYYVIVTREALANLPYSVEEVYGIRSSGRFGTLRQTYHEFYRIYSRETLDEVVHPGMVLTEDSMAGFQFFQSVSEARNIACQSAGGKSGIFMLASRYDGRTGVLLIIADGAAFGPEMDRMSKLMASRDDVILYLPESFEWLILSAGVLKNNAIRSVLSDPASYIESSEYFSWERYFTGLLIAESRGTHLAYSKRTLNTAYLAPGVVQKILREIRKIDFEDQRK